MGISRILRNYDGTPTVVDETIDEGCKLDNSIFAGISSMIIDKDFMDEFRDYTSSTELPKNVVRCLTLIHDKVNDYFSKKEEVSGTRESFYFDNAITGEDEYEIIGTKLSSFKGKGLAKCSEKSVASYLILDQLYKEGKISSKPSIVLSSLSVPDRKSEPHAFILLDNDKKEYPYSHLLFDVSNPAYVSDYEGNKSFLVGLYTLDEKEHEKIINGEKCEPKLIFEVVSPDIYQIGPRRTYGSLEKNKSK